MKFSYETKKACRRCKRELDAVRVQGAEPDAPGLRVSRHIRTGARGFCEGSLEPVPDRGAP